VVDSRFSKDAVPQGFGEIGFNNKFGPDTPVLLRVLPARDRPQLPIDLFLNVAADINNLVDLSLLGGWDGLRPKSYPQRTILHGTVHSRASSKNREQDDGRDPLQYSYPYPAS
jgi:hypothetical protein